MAVLGAFMSKQNSEFHPPTLGGLALEIAQQLIDRYEEIALFAMFDTFCPLPVALGPPVNSHLQHFKKKQYLHYGRPSLRRKLSSGSNAGKEARTTFNAAQQEHANVTLVSDDGVRRMELGFCLANSSELPAAAPQSSQDFLFHGSRQ